jgi:hypothetical protein
MGERRKNPWDLSLSDLDTREDSGECMVLPVAWNWARMGQLSEETVRCNQCGHCCQAASTIALIPSDIERLAKFFQVAQEELLPLIGFNGGEAFIIGDPCPFWQDARCSVYAARPQICRMYPLRPVRVREWSEEPALGVVTLCGPGHLAGNLIARRMRPKTEE